MHQFEATGGHAEAVGDGCTIRKQQAALLCLRRWRAPRTTRRRLLRTTTHSPQTARRCAKRSRA
ncbi:MAG: hypothetical protein LBD24_06575 [Spirochaetaceae bacterium]|nr:hypothetical protein [Spirochaetaceae bacterium]